MAEQQSNRSVAPGEKPALNGKLPVYFYKAEAGEQKAQDAAGQDKKAPSEKTEKKPSHDKKLKEGVRLFRMKRWENALRELRLVDAGDFSGNEQAELAYYLGLCCVKLGRYDEALLYLDQVVSAGNDMLRLYQCRMTLAYIYVITGRSKMAEFELKRLRSNGFESAQLYNTMAYTAYTLKRNQNAIDYYEKVLELDNNNATALNSMGYILADSGIDPARGLRLCRKAVEIRPKSAAYLDSLGWAFYKCHEPIEARNWLRRAMDLAPQEKEIQKHFKIVTGEAP